jgi:hypothetical protein
MAQPTDSDVDLEWLLLQGDAVMGARSTLAGTVNQLESGGGAGGGGNLGEDGLYIHPYTDLQLGTGRCVRGDVERHRWLSTAWFACSVQTRGLLILRHLAPRAMFRSDEGYGARDRHVEGSDGKAGRHGATRTGVEPQLGELANVALTVYENPAELLQACHGYSGDAAKPSATVTGKQAGYGRTIRRARRVAEKALEPAWAEWFESKAAADPMRLPRERRSVQPTHVPAEGLGAE